MFVGFRVERIQLLGDLLIAKLGIVQVAGAQQGADADKALIPAVGFVVANDPADLAGFQVDAKDGSGGDTHGSVKEDAVFHPYI